MKNEKGSLFLGIGLVHVGAATLVSSIFKLGFIALLAACVWHIPAWSKAKHNHTEAQYQSQRMFPAPNPPVMVVHPTLSGNGGNFLGGNSGPVQ